MFTWFRKFTDDWRLVKTFTINVRLDRKSGKMYFHLFESRRGKRRVEIACSLELPSYINVNETAKRFEIYQEQIYRWEHGRTDPDIPRYSQIPEEETANALRGKIS